MAKGREGIALREEDRARLGETLSALLESCPLRAAFVLREDGQFLASEGRLEAGDRDSVSLLLAESWRMLHSLAHAMGQNGQGPSYVLSPSGQTLIQVSPVGRECLLALVCDKDTAAEALEPHAAEASDRLRDLVEEIASRGE